MNSSLQVYWALRMEGKIQKSKSLFNIATDCHWVLSKREWSEQKDRDVCQQPTVLNKWQILWKKKRNSTDPKWSFWIERGILIYYSNRAAVQQMAKEGASSEPLKPPHMPSLCHWQTSSKRISHRDRQISIFPFSFKRPSRRTREERKGSSGWPPVPENWRVSPHSCTLKLIANLGKGDFVLEALSEWNIDAKC